MLAALVPVMRWSPLKRREVLWSIDRKLTTVEEVCRVHKLSPSVIVEWRQRVAPPPRRKNLEGMKGRLLRLLRVSCGTTLTRRHIFDSLYGDAVHPKPKILEVMIWKLRREIPPHLRIINVWGVGYRMEVVNVLENGAHSRHRHPGHGTGKTAARNGTQKVAAR